MSNTEGSSTRRRPGSRTGSSGDKASTVSSKISAAAKVIVGKPADEAIVEVSMLGVSGVGKTTLLASMYEQFGQVIGHTDLSVVTADHVTSARLGDYITALHAMADTLVVKPTLTGTGDVREYKFNVGRRGKKPLFTLRFTDYPGAYLTDPTLAGPDVMERVNRAIERADVVVVAVDVPALIEDNGRYHDKINRPSVITDSIVRMLQQPEERLILLVPLKCEKYLAEKDGPKNLAIRIKQAYAPLLNTVGAEGVRPKVGCVLTPVQTIGSVVFSNLGAENGQPVFNFRTKVVGDKYRPKDTDQPLRWTLRFVVGKYRAGADRGLLRRAWQQMMGHDAVLVAAMADFAGGCKTDQGFDVIQSHPYLQV